MRLKIYFAYGLLFVSLFSAYKSFAFELPSIPFPSPGSDELLFVVRNTTINTKSPVNVTINDYWTNRNVKREPYRDVYGQSVFTTSGSKWLTAYMTVKISGIDYTMAALSGYKSGTSTVFVKSAKTSLSQNFYSVYDFVDRDEISVPSVTYLDETPEYFVTVEAYESGNGNMFVMCISNKQSFNECKSQI
ncbi:thermostable direct hemolysin-family toxin [Vibrio mimicus]